MAIYSKNIEGLDELIKSFNTMADPASYVRLDGTTKQVALLLKQKAKSPGYVPVGTGQLRKSISARKVRVKKDNPVISYTIGPRNVTYNGLVQLGHRIGKSGNKTKPNDFMRRAADDIKDEFLDLLTKSIGEEIERLAGK